LKETREIVIHFSCGTEFQEDRRVCVKTLRKLLVWLRFRNDWREDAEGRVARVKVGG
jgi:hypothetical protein